MNGLVIAGTAVVLAALGPVFGMGHSGDPPQRFDEKAALVGKAPGTVKSIAGAWNYQYRQEDAPLEAKTTDLAVTIRLTLGEDGTYQLFYSARWNLPGPLNPIPAMEGRNVVENGRFSLSGEILLLEPDGTSYTEVKGNRLGEAQHIANQKHALIVRLDKAHLNVAWRCASYQLDPVCKDSRVVWFSMSAPFGPRWLGREPK